MTDYKVEITDSIELHESVTIKKKEGSKGKPIVIQKTGDSYTRDTKDWGTRDMRVDKEKGTYDEIVKTSKGRINKETHESLQEHQGHGSAKHTKKRKPN